LQYQVERCRAGTHGNRIGRTMSLGKGQLEGSNTVPHRDPAAVDDIG
jgi:hypothetical protein